MRRFVLAAMCLVVVLGMSGCYSKPESGEMGVVRNGGPFDNKKIRQIVPNGAGNTWVGWMSSTHYYPVDTQQRFFKMETCYDDGGSNPHPCGSADAVAPEVQTADGVDVQVSGTVYLNTTFNDTEEGIAAIKSFDTQFATRTFSGKHAYEGSAGWSEFLAAIVEPIVANNAREVISGFRCAKLVSSCALVQNTGGRQTINLAKLNNQGNIAQIQKAVEEGLAEDLRQTLGGECDCDYFKNIQFRLKKVQLPAEVQTAINEAQAAFAQVSKAQAETAQARAEAKKNKARQRGYRVCPACARIEAIEALPDGLTALGSGFAVGVK